MGKEPQPERSSRAVCNEAQSTGTTTAQGSQVAGLRASGPAPWREQHEQPMTARHPSEVTEVVGGLVCRDEPEDYRLVFRVYGIRRRCSLAGAAEPRCPRDLHPWLMRRSERRARRRGGAHDKTGAVGPSGGALRTRGGRRAPPLRASWPSIAPKRELTAPFPDPAENFPDPPI